MRTLFAEFTSMPAATIKALVSSFPGLTVLTMSVGDQASVAAIAELTKNLLSCKLSGLGEQINSTTAAVICKYWKRVIYLTVYNPDNASCCEDALAVLIEGLPNLQRLRLIRSSLDKHRDHILPRENTAKTGLLSLQTDFISVATMQRILTARPALHTFQLRCSAAHSEATVTPLLCLLRSTALMKLVLEDCVLTDDDLHCIHNLTHLYLVDVRGQFSTAAVQVMAQQNPNLRVFHLSSSPDNANYRNVRTMLKTCPQLEQLCVTNPGSVFADSPTHDALQQMTKEFYPNLKTVHLVL